MGKYRKRIKLLFCCILAGMFLTEQTVSAAQAEEITIQPYAGESRAAEVGTVFQVEDLEYTVDEINPTTGRGRVSCTGPKGVLSQITIPSTVEYDNATYDVWRIGKNAFGDLYISSNPLRELIIAEGITEIGEGAFRRCSNLTSVVLPESLTKIGEVAFDNCVNLQTIDIPAGVTEIEASAFQACRSLSGITIPEGITVIGRSMFMNCVSLTDVVLSENITVIEELAFGACSMEHLEIPRSVTAIKDLAMGSCKKLSELTLWDTTKLEGEQIFEYCSQFVTLKLIITSDLPVPVIVSSPDDCFQDCPTERRIVFLGQDGTELTGTALSAAQNAYRAVNDGNTSDDLWYGWKIGSMSRSDHTVTFYDGDSPYGSDTAQHPQTVSDGQKAVRPTDPVKAGSVFLGWVTEKDGTVPFDFDNTDITAETKIYANWRTDAVPEYQITASAGEGGIISPKGTVKVDKGESMTFSITPQEDYRIDKVMVDGVDQGAVDSYSFQNVENDHAISVSFVKKTGFGGSGGTPENSDETGGTPENSGGTGETPEVSDNNEGEAENSAQSEENNAPGDTHAESQSIPAANRDAMPKPSEPKTGEEPPLEIYATVAMIAGLLYLSSCFAEAKGMTGENKRKLVSAIIEWAKRGKWYRRYAALVAIFFVLLYYHSIGKYFQEETTSVLVVSPNMSYSNKEKKRAE